LNVNSYISTFGFRNGQVDIRSNYIWSASDEDIEKFGVLNFDASTMSRDDTRIITDTPLEFALLSYYSPVVIQIRPEQAKAILPANNPKLAGLKLGEATYRELVMLNFLDPSNTRAIGRYEGMLKSIEGRSGVKRPEIEAYYRNGIRGFIAEIVDEEFNKISFLLDSRPGVSYNAVLARNPQTGQYILSYGGVETNGEIRTVTGNSVEALSSEMRNGKNKADFAQLSIDQIKAQARLIPAMAYPASVLNAVVDTIAAFYLNPSQSTFHALGVRYRTFLLNDADKGRAAARRFYEAMYALNVELATEIIR
jgi:hypothetical protein